MLIIADGGATKADWIIVKDNGEQQLVSTTGFNPNYVSGERIAEIIAEELAGKLPFEITGAVYYYGTGCWDKGRNRIVQEAIAKVLTQAKVVVHHDLLAAARATCGHQPGIACILGTGSNSVLYDGEKEVDNVTNLGFLLGDEGSGAQIGKAFVQAFFYREMPEELQPIMDKVCPNGRKDILDKVYSGGIPAAYLASFTQLFTEHQAHPFVRGLVKKCFNEFLTRHVCKYENHENLPVCFVGSVAHYFLDILQEALSELGLTLGPIVKKPINKLVEFHLELAN
jgi:N-acetylglucosamine kinase-like BadF-type ATPase